MDQHRLKYLLERARQQLCSADELKELDNWFHTTDVDGGDMEQWLQQAGGAEGLSDELYQDFSSRLSEKGKNKGIYTVLKIAASVIVVIIVGLLFYQKKSNEGSPVQQLAVNKQPVPVVIKPGGNKAMLTLANGAKIALDDIREGDLAMQQDIHIQKTADGKIAYAGGKHHRDNGKVIYNTLTTPRGGRYDLKLADGTLVTLDAESSITYPVTFSGKERMVEITGQAYLQVVHNNRQPFRVKVKGQIIEDIGTSFNVNGYDDDASVKITLAEGKVNVSNNQKTVSLVPGQQAIVKNGQTDIRLKTVNIDEIGAWKNGWFVFHNETVMNVMRQAARWYDVDVEYQGDMSAKRFGGTISRYKDISELLENLKISGGIQYKIEGRRVMLTN